jgi:hypothetical protein
MMQGQKNIKNVKMFRFYENFYILLKCELAVGHRGLETCGSIVLK